jgi:TPR repeat protein
MEDNDKARLQRATTLLIDADDWNGIERLWEPYIRAGDTDAEGELACIYENNGFDEGAAKSREIRELLVKAAANGHADAIYRLADFQTEGRERDELLCKAAEKGNRAAQRDLGALYATGDWTLPKDPALAIYWYTRAAERGESDAQYNLGFMYILSEGTQQDLAKGLAWLRTSAGQGHTGAMRLLADLYRNAYYGVPRDAQEAERWDRRARTEKDQR